MNKMNEQYNIEPEIVREHVQIQLPSVEGEYIEGNCAQDWYSYLRISLSELEDGDTYTGKPLLLPVESVQFGEEDSPKYRCRLLLVDDAAEEYLQININLKSKEDTQKNVHNASSLYALVGGIMNLSDPNWTRTFNRIKSVKLSDWETYLASKETMTVRIVAKEGNGFNYNSFRILELL